MPLTAHFRETILQLRPLVVTRSVALEWLGGPWVSSEDGQKEN